MKELNEMTEIELRVLQQDVNSRLKIVEIGKIPPEVMKELQDEWDKIKVVKCEDKAYVCVTAKVCHVLILTNNIGYSIDTCFDINTPFEDEDGENEDEILNTFPTFLTKRNELDSLGRNFIRKLSDVAEKYNFSYTKLVNLLNYNSCYVRP